MTIKAKSAFTNDNKTAEESILSEVRKVEVEDINYDDGSFYSGEVRKGQKHGTGKIIFNYRGYYKGDFKNDLYNGKGNYSKKMKLYMMVILLMVQKMVLECSLIETEHIVKRGNGKII